MMWPMGLLLLNIVLLVYFSKKGYDRGRGGVIKNKYQRFEEVIFFLVLLLLNYLTFGL